ncbi:MAG: carbohydrate ABC transporter permease [Trueperaceae bacterium]|nr:carbohydrate ABC transporter permease [Trueperaceae bacterium]
MGRRVDGAKIAAWVVLGVYLVFVFVPFLFTFITSFKPVVELTRSPITYLPENFTLQAYRDVLFNQAYSRYLLNTLIISLVVVTLCAIFGVPAAYAMARYRFPFRRPLMVATISIRLLPPIALIVPFFMLVSALGAIDSLVSLVLVNFMLNLPFFIWIAWGFMKDLPWSLEDAALIDGATRLQALWRITMPIAAPGLGAAAIVSFLFTWNEYLFALTFSQSAASKTISVGISDFVGDVFVRWNLISAAGILTTIPALIFVVLFQRYIVQGITAGGVKG